VRSSILVAVSLLAVSLGGLIEKATRPTNSGSATRRGRAAFDGKDKEVAAKLLRDAEALRSTPATQFNRGTAEVAAGKQVEGSDYLTRAMADPSLRSYAFYNRGSSALAANAFDRAIRDYSEALRLDPSDRAAKRNLEIALRQREKQQQRQAQGQDSPPQQRQPAPTPGPSPGASPTPTPGPQDADAESLLRSVDQQEREELSRMRRSRSVPGKIGW